MNQSDLLFLVVILILLSTLTVFVVQFWRSRRGGGEGDGRAGWWEGPWDDDDRKR
ncbi:hypothetical protein JOF42_000151 [Microbacterium phyllosphaerae]|uniref:Uncharacterized protein n=1 Tax=Microbacterium phyllosphaerae TaxID=124798 RepID=A0ABS4WKD1_9MICO|nr:hypothetical protein [Microbacterium phyllosphaerae]MBP2376656.1 hypothetical protein [Microbacterium phyllosphaerae]MCS3443361.1 hypothetical protein [Microbacterium phyllosphaerae]